MRGVTGSSGLLRVRSSAHPNDHLQRHPPRGAAPRHFQTPQIPDNPHQISHCRTLIDAVDEKEGNSWCFLGPLIRGLNQQKIKRKCLFHMEIWLNKEVQENPTEEYFTHGSHSMGVSTSFHQQRLLQSRPAILFHRPNVRRHQS